MSAEAKRCENPECGKEFTKRSHEKLSAFKKRRACCFDCGKVVGRLGRLRGYSIRRRATFAVPVPSKLEILGYAQQQSARFWKKVAVSSVDACWPWRAQCDKDGYGKFAITLPTRDGKQRQSHARSHRLAWELTHNELLGERLATHSCDNPRCCNPSHISPGTCLSNMHEKMTRGRARVRCADPELIQAVRDEYLNSSATQMEIAAKYGLHRTTVGRMVRGQYKLTGPTDPVTRRRRNDGTFAVLGPRRRAA